MLDAPYATRNGSPEASPLNEPCLPGIGPKMLKKCGLSRDPLTIWIQKRIASQIQAPNRYQKDAL